MPKLRLFTYDTLHLGLIAPVVFPTMTYDNLVGSSNMTFSPQLVFEFDSKFVDVALNFGYSMRDDNSLKFRSQTVKIDDAIVGSLGAKVLLWENRLELVGDSYFSMDVNEQNEEEVPVEIIGGLRFYFPAGFQADVGAGAGLTKGVNAPTYRLLAGLKWRPVEAEKVYVEKVKYINTKCPVVNCPLKTCPKVERNKITIPSVYFDTDKDFVIPQSIPVLLDVVQILKDNPWVKEVRVEGNADWRASNTYNYKLALRRAQYVYNFLVRNGVDKDRIFTVSFGEGSPAYSNATKEGMSRNRRVEFHITQPK